MNYEKIQYLKNLISEHENEIARLRKDLATEYGQSVKIISDLLVNSYNGREIRNLVSWISRENELPGSNAGARELADSASIIFLDNKETNLMFQKMRIDRPRRIIEIDDLEALVNRLISE